MFLSTEALDKILYCPQCEKRYDPNERIPKILPCNETICSECIQLLESPFNCVIETCKTVHELPDKGFPINNVTLTILEMNPVNVDLGEVDKQMKNLITSSGQQLNDFLQDVKQSKKHIEEYYNMSLIKIQNRVIKLVNELNTNKSKLVNELNEHKDSLLAVLGEGGISNFIIESWTYFKELQKKSNDPTINDTERKSIMNKCKQFENKIEYMKEYFEKFKSNLGVYQESSKVLDSSFIGELIFKVDNYYKIKFNDLNNNSCLKIPINNKKGNKFLWSRILSKNLLLNFYSKKTDEYILETTDSNDTVINEIKLSNKIDLCECFGKRIVLCEDIYEGIKTTTVIKLYDTNLRFIKSRKLDEELKLHYINNTEIFFWSMTQPHIRVFNHNLEPSDSFGQRINANEKFYLDGSAYWIFGANCDKFFVGNMLDTVEIFCRKTGQLLKTQKIEGLDTWYAVIDSESRVIVIIKSKNLVKIYDSELNFMGESKLDFIEYCSSFQITSDDDIVFIDYINNSIRIV